MFITLQGAELNSDLIKKVELKGKTIILTDTNNTRSIYYFTNSKEAKETKEDLIKKLNE